MSSGTSAATTVKNAGAAATPAKVVTPEATAKVMTPDVYNWFIGIFGFVLSLIVLVTTGSILSVLVLWVTIALVLTVLVYYGILDIDKTIGQEVKAVEKAVEPIERPSGAPMVGSEVFHISDQQFTYDEAPAVCAAYGGDMATLEQIMDVYAKGGEWCGYGWSAGGMALYPTQRETWERLQGEVDTGKRTRCGRPGVNGGYFDPSLKFGVNCYGFKPKGDFKPPAPIPGSDTQKFRDMVNKFRTMLKSLTVDPYSRMEWSANPVRNVIETFVGHGFGMENLFKQDFYTPHGVKEDFSSGDPRYVEPIAAGGAANSARSVGGPYGLMGDRGPSGASGSAGPAGPAGPDGSKGGIGPAGSPGPMGPEGPEGKVGPGGPAGPKGDKGPKGDQGERGPPGSGSAGGIGPKGDKGDKGDSVRGEKGEKGDKGDRGERGQLGPQGAQGPQGIQGAGGPMGPAGVFPRTPTVDSIRLGNIIVDTSTRNGDQLSIRDVRDGKETGFMLDPNGDTSTFWMSQRGGWRQML
jgi:hypothetical protein